MPATLGVSFARIAKSQRLMGKHLCSFFLCILLFPLLICGCGHFNETFQAKPVFREASDLFSRGKYTESLNAYQRIIDKYPTTADRVLFQMGIIYAYPENALKDYSKAVECFQTLIRDYPESGYRRDSEMMIFYIDTIALKDTTIAAQQTRIDTLQQEVKKRENEIAALVKKVEALEKKAFAFALHKVSADRIVIEKKERRLTLFTEGEVLKTYKIALGGNPEGPKERQGDNKTPEGIYFIDSRNRDSQYHLALHISYPNERDKKRAKELGVSPGGDIMIHGIKKGFSWVGELQSDIDWTKGCIAVTDEEIEEIDQLAPDGTVVEIRP